MKFFSLAEVQKIMQDLNIINLSEKNLEEKLIRERILKKLNDYCRHTWGKVAESKKNSYPHIRSDFE
jgi:activator of HSP90 ATPase